VKSLSCGKGLVGSWYHLYVRYREEHGYKIIEGCIKGKIGLYTQRSSISMLGTGKNGLLLVLLLLVLLFLFFVPKRYSLSHQVIGACLSAVFWCHQVVVVGSHA